jgi:hypothetical protein
VDAASAGMGTLTRVLGQALVVCILETFRGAAKARTAKEPPPMNVLLWVLQVTLALLYLAGGGITKRSCSTISRTR